MKTIEAKSTTTKNLKEVAKILKEEMIELERELQGITSGEKHRDISGKERKRAIEIELNAIEQELSFTEWMASLS